MTRLELVHAGRAVLEAGGAVVVGLAVVLLALGAVHVLTRR